jgi:antitoxin MazE
MHAKVQRWGNSLAVRIPKSIAEQVGLGQGALVDLEVEGGALNVRPVAPAEYTLDALLGSITDENRHDEVGTAGPVGSEAW